MKLPERVKIVGLWYSIEVANHELEIEDLTASISYKELKLRINDNRPFGVIREAIFHELLHGAGSILPSELRLSELQVCVVSELLLQTLTDNPEIRKFIFGE